MILISACLAGIACRYDGKAIEHEGIMQLVKAGKAMLVCPEMLGGLPSPRTSCEQHCNADGTIRVKTKAGADHTDAFKLGAQKTLDIARIVGAETAILKSRSPSCGCGKIYDGTFSGKLIPGNGFTAQLLLDHNINVITEEEME